MVVDRLRAAGHEVYNFRQPRPGQHGFSWHDIDPSMPRGPADLHLPSAVIRTMLGDPVADDGFRSDMDALRWCDACVLVLPSGRSAHLEMGWAAGAQKWTAVLLDDGEPDLMWKMANALCVTLEEVVDALAGATLVPAIQGGADG